MQVSFTPPTTTGGTPPVQISCTPASGSVFDIGSKSVTCIGTDTKNVSAQCSFTVTLTAPPRLRVTNFVAFGDSMTRGEVVSEGFGGRIRTLMIDDAKAYPTILTSLLVGRYTAQAGQIFVGNSGVKAETAVDGASRLRGVIPGAYDVLLLMEGVNDFPNYQAALTAIQNMVRYAKANNVRVYLATEPPENPFAVTCPPNHAANWAFVDPYNAGLRLIAAAENVALVDVNAAFHGDTTTLIDCDGLHPTPQGYIVIANAFFDAIKSTLEIPSTATPTNTILRTLTAPARRSR
jgi:lysophospholipase L1-like esterase